MSNKLCLWRDSVLYLGDSFDPQMHSHHAIQCCLALKGKLKISWQGKKNWESCQAAVIGSNIPHSISNPEGPLCILFLEKTSQNYESILGYQCITTISEVSEQPLILKEEISESSCQLLLKALTDQVSVESASKLKQLCLRIFHGEIDIPKKVGASTEQVLNAIHKQSDFLYRAEELSAIAGLSESRMQHLFKEQVGVPIRKYMQWVRLRHVLQLAIAGESLTRASLQAGFSDSAHFTRTFKAMFGIAPSLFLTGGDGLTTLFCD